MEEMLDSIIFSTSQVPVVCTSLTATFIAFVKKKKSIDFCEFACQYRIYFRDQLVHQKQFLSTWGFFFKMKVVIFILSVVNLKSIDSLKPDTTYLGHLVLIVEIQSTNSGFDHIMQKRYEDIPVLGQRPSEWSTVSSNISLTFALNKIFRHQ